MIGQSRVSLCLSGLLYAIFRERRRGWGGLEEAETSENQDKQGRRYICRLYCSRVPVLVCVGVIMTHEGFILVFIIGCFTLVYFFVLFCTRVVFGVGYVCCRVPIVFFLFERSDPLNKSPLIVYFIFAFFWSGQEGHYGPLAIAKSCARVPLHARSPRVPFDVLTATSRMFFVTLACQTCTLNV